jgi:hypothetical protein
MTHAPKRDPEDAIQATKYQELCKLIAEARSRGEDFVCRGAKQIALLRWKDERKFKRVYGKERYPYTVHAGIFHLSADTFERWEQYLEFSKLRGFDPFREAEKYGFGPPSAKKKQNDGGDGTPPAAMRTPSADDPRGSGS